MAEGEDRFEDMAEMEPRELKDGKEERDREFEDCKEKGGLIFNRGFGSLHI